MNLQKMRSLVRTNLGLHSDEAHGQFNNELINHFLNEAQKFVRIDLEDRIENTYNNFVTNQRMYTPPADYLKIREIWVGRDTATGFEGYEMEARSYKNLVDSNKYATNRSNPNEHVSQGRPERYYISSDEVLYVDPVPTSTTRFDIFYLPYPSAMTSDTDEPDFKEVFHSLIVNKAAQLMSLNSDVLSNKANLKNQNYLIELNQLKPFARSRETNYTKTRVNSPFRRV